MSDILHAKVIIECYAMDLVERDVLINDYQGDITKVYLECTNGDDNDISILDRFKVISVSVHECTKIESDAKGRKFCVECGKPHP